LKTLSSSMIDGSWQHHRRCIGIQFKGIPYIKTTYNDHLCNGSMPVSLLRTKPWLQVIVLLVVVEVHAANTAPYAARKPQEMDGECKAKVRGVLHSRLLLIFSSFLIILCCASAPLDNVHWSLSWSLISPSLLVPLFHHPHQCSLFHLLYHPQFILYSFDPSIHTFVVCLPFYQLAIHALVTDQIHNEGIKKINRGEWVYVGTVK